MNFNFTPGDDKKNPLTQFGRNLTDDVLKNKIDPIIGRDEEIRRIIEIISRKTKNNPVLIGEPGVGKTAIVEGLAQRIINGDVPENLKDKEIYELNLPSLLAGASFQGQFEERLNNVIKQIKESDGKIILFIDEIHMLVGAGKNAGGGAMDAANILKPMMARGEIRLIGATTLNEYRQYIEKDSAFERRMQKVLVREPSKQEALTIMRGLREKWEDFHKVKIHDSALISAVELSDRYITDRYLPDKAIDLIDEAAAKIKTEMSSLPTELDQVNRKIIHIKTELASLKNETDEKSIRRLKEVEKELEEAKILQEKQNKIWSSQKEEHIKLMSLKKEYEDAKSKIEKLQTEGDFEKASKLMYVTIPKLEVEIKDFEEKINKENKLVKDSVTSNEIAEVISKATGIPLNKVVASEKEKLLKLGDELKKYVKGQDVAVEIVANAILRGRAGINDPNKPIGSFLFMGSTGVGKTQLAKAIAKELFDNENSIVRVDMSEYMEKHSVSKLLGAPPGYVGYDQPGYLTEEVRRKPYSVVLLDEIEKAHGDVLNVLLQVLDDGRLKDSQGRVINFKNTLIIMTSNIGSNEIIENKKDEALKELKRYLKPEFINRIDEIVIFNPIDEETIKKIIKQKLDELISRVKEQDYIISFSDNIIEKIKENGYEAQFGARPIKRYIQKNIENELAKLILENKIEKGKKYILGINKAGEYQIKDDKKN